MGQDTYIKTGAYVKVTLTMDHLETLTRLIRDVKNERIDGYVHYDGELSDEVYCLSNVIYGEELMEGILAVSNEKDLASVFKTFRLKEKPRIFFLYQFSGAYARNISRRDNPHIFDKSNGDGMTLNDVIKNCQIAQHYFLEHGFKETEIKIGSSIDLDS